MLASRDEGKGLVQITWDKVRQRVKKVSPEFVNIIDNLSPDDSFPLYLAYYPYGDLIGDTESLFLPTVDGESYRLTDENIPKEVKKNLGYGSQSSPLAMLLDKNLEYFVDIKDVDISIPWKICKPGTFFPLNRILQNKSDRIYTPNGILTTVSGARSTFMLPKIGCYTNHLMLQRDYNIESPPPKSLNDHWDVFKQIVRSNPEENIWRSCIMFFSKKWVDKLHNDIAWHPLKKFLLELGWTNIEYVRNHIYYNIAYSVIQQKRNLKPNPYLVDTAAHLFAIAVGANPGYVPASDNELLPLKSLQDAFVESYGQKKYIPTIMVPEHLVIENKTSSPVYYSLQHPTTLSFSPKSRSISSTLFELRELKHIMDVFSNELSKSNNILSDTIISEAAKKIEFSYFHNNVDNHKLIQKSDTIITYDKRFNAKYTYKNAPNSSFASDAPFLRGCVSVGLKKK